MKTSPSHLPGAQTTRGDASIHLYRQVPHLQETETFPWALLKFSVSWLTLLETLLLTITTYNYVQ